MRQLSIINSEQATKEEIGTYNLRHAARAVIIDEGHNLAILDVSAKYYKLPGGGIETGESELDALRRECREEAGVEIEIIGEIGKIIEYRKIFHLVQTSSCYLAQVIGDKGDPHFTKSELQEGFHLNWLPYNEVMSCLNMCIPDSIEARDYIVPREKLFLETARKMYPAKIISAGKQNL